MRKSEPLARSGRWSEMACDFRSEESASIAEFNGRFIDTSDRSDVSAKIRRGRYSGMGSISDGLIHRRHDGEAPLPSAQVSA